MDTTNGNSSDSSNSSSNNKNKITTRKETIGKGHDLIDVISKGHDLTDVISGGDGKTMNGKMKKMKNDSCEWSEKIMIENIEFSEMNCFNKTSTNYATESSLLPSEEGGGPISHGAVTGEAQRANAKMQIYANPLASSSDHQYYALVTSSPSNSAYRKHYSFFQRMGNQHIRTEQRRPTKLLFYLMAACIVTISIFTLTCTYSFRNTNDRSSTDAFCISEECIKAAAFLIAGMNQTVNPCDDFFQYACGLWNSIHVIPEDKSTINTFEVLTDQLQIVLRRLLEEPINEKDNQVTVKAKTFYTSCIAAEREQYGNMHILPLIKWLGGWPVIERNWSEATFDLETLLARLKLAYNEDVLIEQWIGPDDKNSSANVIQVDQLILGLPGREYFLLAESGNAVLQAYYNFMFDVAVQLGGDKNKSATESRAMIKFEMELANITIPEVDRQDTNSIYTKLQLKNLQEQVPQFNWKKYFSVYLNTEIDDQEPIVSYSQLYFTNLGKLLESTDKRIIQNYVIWRLLMDTIIPYMSNEFRQLQTNFKKVLYGISSERDRWNQCVDWTNKKLGMGVGSLFVRNNFNSESKDAAMKIIKTIREAFNELLMENEWMDEATKKVAKDKANAINEHIGYPDILTDIPVLEKEFENLEIGENFFINVLSVLRFESDQNILRLHQPVKRDKWSTEPAVVNAFYNPNKNNIVFPAGILQPFFYSKHFPPSINYGGIGVVIGHEITHGFDDKGRLFDKDGNLVEWWDNNTINAFRKQTQCIIDQYSNYRIDEIGINLNGELTQGENIADNGGLKQAYRAYKKYVAEHGNEPLLPGLQLNHDQLFFLNYAQIWCGTTRPEDALAKIRSSAHAPGKMRVLGPLSNSKEFSLAYKCPEGSRMNPKRKCSVW